MNSGSLSRQREEQVLRPRVESRLFYSRGREKTLRRFLSSVELEATEFAGSDYLLEEN